MMIPDLRTVKRIYRFFKASTINPDYIYSFFIEEVLKKYVKRSKNKKVIIIFDHTTLDDRFLILKFSLKVGKRAIPLWYKIFEYNEKGNENFDHIKEGIIELNEIFTSYNYEVILLADRGFKSIDLFRFIDKLGWKYCIRCGQALLDAHKIKEQRLICSKSEVVILFYNFCFFKGRPI